MKKFLKVLTLLVALSLIVCAVVISTSAAENGRLSELENPWQFTDSSGNVNTTATISDAVSRAKEGSTIKLLCDQTVAHDSTVVTINKKLTFDLDGHSFKISQADQVSIFIATTDEVVFKNGTLVASGNSSFGTSGKGYAIFRNGKSGIKLTLDNVNTYSACVLLSGWSDAPTLTINGGEHYVIFQSAHMAGAGIIDSRLAATVNVNDAIIYLGSGARLLNSQSYNSSSDDKAANFTFKNSKILTQDGSESIIGVTNENTSVIFDGCDICGSISTTLSTEDTKKSIGEIKEGAIVLGGGTRWIREGRIIPDVVACKAGESVLDTWDEANYTLHLSDGSLYYNTTAGSLSNIFFRVNAGTDYMAKFDSCYGADGNYAFRFNVESKTYYSDDLVTAFESGTDKITLMKPISVALNNKIVIDRDIVIDLGGNTLEIVESGNSSWLIGAGVSVTVKNGNIVKIKNTGAPAQNPVFATDGEGAFLEMQGVSVDAGSLISVYNEGCGVKIAGGVYGNFEASNSASFAYIECYGASNIEITDATLLAGPLPVFSLIGVENKAELTRVTVLGNTADSLFVDAIDQDTKIILNDCDVFASLAMLCYASADELRGAVVLGEGTRISSFDAEQGIIRTAHGKAFITDKTTEAVQCTIASGKLVSRSCTFEYTVSSPAASDVATCVMGDLTLFTDDIKEAFSLADSGSDIILVKDITLTESEKAFITVNTENLTLDLGGHVFEVIQQGEASIDIHKNFTIKNGTIRAAMDSSVGDTYKGRSYPVLRYGIGIKGVDLVLENVNTYAGSLIFAWNCSDHSLTVIGGRHHAETRGTGNDNGWLDVRGDFKFTARDAVFYINNSSNVISALSFKDTDTSVLASSFDFVGCDIISEDGKSNAIGFANENCRFSFTDCDIYASINPELNSNDKNAGYGPIGAGAIVLGESVRLSSVGTFISGGVIVPADGCEFTDMTYSGRVVYESYTFIPETSHFAINDKFVNVSYSNGTDSLENLMITVKWYTEDGFTLIREDVVRKGTVLTPPTYSAGVSNGWFRTGYSGWTIRFASTVAVNDFTATKDISYYPCVSDAVISELTVARYNLTLVGKVCNNIYLPVTPIGVSIKGVYVNGTEITGSKVMIDGVKHYMYTVSEVGAARLNTVTTVTVKYIAAGEELTATLSLNPLSYAETVLKDAESASPVYSATAHAVAADLIRYSNALSLVVDGTTDSALDSLMERYGKYASALATSNSFADYRANTTALAGIISSISLEVSATEPRWVFTAAEGVNIHTIEVVLDGYLPKVTNGVNFGTITYKAERKGDTGTYFTEYIPIYNLDRMMTVKVYLVDGSEYVGKYSLNAYFNGFVADEDTTETVKGFLRAFRSLGKASAEYKYGTDIKSDTAIVDFFKCDHESIGLFVEGKGRYCPDCATYVFFYSDFGAVADGTSDRNFTASGTNNHEMMCKCHQAANAWSALGNKTAVQAVGGAHNGTTYYIGAQYLAKSASIMTDTSWAGAEFIVDDRTVHIGEGDGFNTPVFTATVKSVDWAINYTSRAPAAGLAAGSKNVGFAPGRPMMLRLVDNSRRNNIRQGANENEGASISEVILVDEYGNISSETPVEWDYFNVTFCKYGCTTVDANLDKKCDICTKAIVKSMNIYGYATDVDPITVSGLDKDGNIDFVWETITDSTVDIEHYTQCGRRFKVERSNVTVMGIDHIFTEDDVSSTPRTAYAGIVNVNLCNNVTVSNMIVTHHISHSAKDGVGMGSYEFSGNQACNINLIGYRTRNFFTDDGNVYYRGLFGTNYIRNFYLKDCVLTSFDSHSGAYNAVLEDCTFEHINFVGGGNAYLKNVIVYTDGGDAACVLRQDYGSMWRGNIYFDGLTLRYTDTTNKCIDLVKAYYTNWNFGTETYLPEEIIANNVKIERYSRTTDDYECENGLILEDNIISENEIPLGLHYTINKQMVSHVDYSTANPANFDGKHCTKRFELNNSGSLKLLYPDHTYFANMEVFVDGVEQDWFVKRASLMCEDFDGDYVCDVCKYEIECKETHPTDGTSVTKCAGCGNLRKVADGETSEILDVAFEYQFNGNTVKAYEGAPLTDVLASADSGSTVKMMLDHTIELTSIYSVSKNIKLDLGGKRLTVYTDPSTAAFSISANKTMTFENGTVVCMIKSTEYTKGRPLVMLGNGSTVNYNNVTAFVSCLAFSYNGNDCKVNINGGEYYAIATSQAGMSSFFEMRANVTFVANDALFYLTNLATGTSYNFISISSNYEASGTKSSVLTFNNCNIIRNDKGNLIGMANEFTKIYFNGCNIYGKLNNGSLYSIDKSQGTAASQPGFIVLGSGTSVLKNTSSWISSTTYIDTNVTYATGCTLASNSKSVSYTLKKISGTGDGITITGQSKSYSYTGLVS